MKKSLVAFLAALVVVFTGLPALAAEKAKGALLHSVPLHPLATGMKATRLSVPLCFGTYLADVNIAPPTTDPSSPPTVNERLAVVVFPAFCMETGQGITFHGHFTEERRRFTVKGLTYLLLVKGDESYPAGYSYPAGGEEVLAATTQPIEFSVGKTMVRVWPREGTFLSAKVAGKASGSVFIQTTSPSGSSLLRDGDLNDVLILDRALPVYPGTAVVSPDGALVGMVFGSDNGQTVVVSTNELYNAMCQSLGDGCKG